MTQVTGALLVFGLMCAGALVMFVLERRAALKRKEARGGREVDLSVIFAPDGPLARKDAEEGRL